MDIFDFSSCSLAFWLSEIVSVKLHRKGLTTTTCLSAFLKYTHSGRNSGLELMNRLTPFLEPCYQGYYVFK